MDIKCTTKLTGGVVKDTDYFVCDVGGETVEVNSWEVDGKGVDAKHKVSPLHNKNDEIEFEADVCEVQNDKLYCE